MDQYRALHKFIFKNVSKSVVSLPQSGVSEDKATTTNASNNETLLNLANNAKWLLKCMPAEFDPTATTTTATTINITPQGAAQLSVYFQDANFDLILKKFSNRYVISEIQKQMIHLECFYNYFVEKHLMRSILAAMQQQAAPNTTHPARNNTTQQHSQPNPNSLSSESGHAANNNSTADGSFSNPSSSFSKPIARVFSLNCRLIGYMCGLLGAISSAYSINKIQPGSGSAADDANTSSTSSAGAGLSEGKNLAALFKNDILIAPKNFQSNLNIKLNRKFLHQTCILPNKLLLLISSYRLNYPVRYVFKSDNSTIERIEVMADDPAYTLDDSDNQVTFFLC